MTDHGAAGHGIGRRGLLGLTLTTIGVVYGDIGTSPLYTIRECFFGTHPVPPTSENVLGVLSLVVYALLIIISIKYIAIVMRADNQGEGGILALTALIPSRDGGNTADRFAATRPVLVLLGIFGAALLYGDGMITPAISVLGATEGLNVITPLFEPYVVPLSVVILIALFVMQKFGTHRVGGLFGPVMVLWFLTIAVLGITWIARAPEVLTAVDPRHAIRFFRAEGTHAFLALGAVFLAVTGGEALYADMGHFGKRPIRIAWFSLVLPALLLNYFGQGALLLHNTGGGAALLHDGARLGAAAAGRAGDDGGDHRLTGIDLRRLLADAAGDPARLCAASRRRAHLVARNGTGLRPAGQHRARHRHDPDRHRLRNRRARWPRPTVSPSR